MVMPGTRPDICYAVTKLSQHMSKPTKAHLSMAKHVLRYLKGTLDYGLEFQKSADPLKLIGYCDSDWGGSEDRRSISGYGFELCDQGPLISWKSRKQQCVSLSSCEAEYVALTGAFQEAKFLRQLFIDMYHGNNENSVLLNVDNQGALALAKNPVFHKRSKHIDIKYHYIRSEVQNGIVQLKYVPKEDNVADVTICSFQNKNNSKLLFSNKIFLTVCESSGLGVCIFVSVRDRLGSSSDLLKSWGGSVTGRVWSTFVA